jgi:hypothetical protein
MATRQANPADESNQPSVAERTRIPMSVPVAKLAVPEIPGYHLHWFNGTPERLMRAQTGGYEFVDMLEVQLNQRTLGSDTAQDGNTDMGTRVSVVAGDELDRQNQPMRLYLMKIKEEWWLEDQRALEAEGSRLDNVRKSLLGGMIGAEKESGEDRSLRYVDKSRTKIPDFLKRKL